MDELEQARAQAMDNGHESAAVSATKEKSLTGHRIERAEIGAPGEFDAMSDDELLASIRERFARLDREVRPANNNGSITLNGASDDE